MQRQIVLNPIEPALLSLRWPVGVELVLDVSMLDQTGAPVDPRSYTPQLALLPRSRGGVVAYDMAVEDIPNGVVRTFIPSGALQDLSGYSLEMYARRPAANPEDPPIPYSLLAKGVLRLEASTYQSTGPFSAINVPTVIGPPGPQGVPGPTGERGTMWFTGNGPPDTTVGIEGKITGDMYLDNGLMPGGEGTGDVYRFDGAVWILGSF